MTGKEIPGHMQGHSAVFEEGLLGGFFFANKICYYICGCGYALFAFVIGRFEACRRVAGAHEGNERVPNECPRP